MKYAVGTVSVLALLLSAPLSGQTIVIEAQAGVEALTPCVPTHVVSTCQTKHPDGVEDASVGSTILLDGEEYLIEWMGPGYHLSSGVILEPLGETAEGLKGQLWLEVYPDEGKTHTSSGWVDLDGNQALSASDRLALDSDPPVIVMDVRLQLRVKPSDPAP